jgi:trans-aconitate 2-methyltransferase
MENNQPTYKDVSNYYNEEWASLENKKLTGINSRHRNIMKFLKKYGLKKDSQVLEIGCGIGTLSSFISSKLKNGSITGVDISDETINQNRVRYKHLKNLDFIVSDMTNFSINKKYDIIIFPDVLEHIPIEAHENIFKTTSSLIKQNGLVFINIPNPRALEYLHIHNKELLQIIDQPIHTNILLNKLYENNFYIEQLKSYSVFYEEMDYQMMIVKPNNPFNKMNVKPKYKVIYNNIILRLKDLLSG